MGKSANQKRRKANRIPILIVEDNADDWLIIRSALAQCFPEVEPIWINNTTQVVTYLNTCLIEKRNWPRIILSELYLPCRENGLAMIASIKMHPVFRQIPIIILSHSEDHTDINESYNCSIASYIIKPNTYHQWLGSLYIFRRYWWDYVTFIIRPLQVDA